MKLRRWQKVVLYLGGALAVLLILLGSWIAMASRDIPPPDFHDLDYPFVQVATEANAHTWFLEARKLLVWGEHERDIYERLRDPSTNRMKTATMATGAYPATSNQLVVLERLQKPKAESRPSGPVSDAEVEAILATNAPALTMLRRGLACEVSQPPVATNSQALDGIGITEQINLAWALSLERRWRSRNGDDAGAMTNCIEQLRFGDLQIRHAPTFVQFLVGQAIVGMGVASAWELAATNRLDEASLRVLDQALQKVDAGTNGLPGALRGEFLFGSAVLAEIKTGKLPLDVVDAYFGSTGGRLYRKFGLPGFLLRTNETRLAFAEASREAIRNAPLLYRDMRFRDYEAEWANDPGMGRRLLWQGNVIGKFLVEIMRRDSSMDFKAVCRARCDHAGARILIALRRYERRNGHLPEKLDELVPEFIEEVPRDPFDGQSLRYSRERRILWAVGENLRDDGGSKKDRKSGEETVNRRRMLDYVIDLPAL